MFVIKKVLLVPTTESSIPTANLKCSNGESGGVASQKVYWTSNILLTLKRLPISTAMWLLIRDEPASMCANPMS